MKTTMKFLSVIALTGLMFVQACGQAPNPQTKKDPQAAIKEERRRQEAIKTAIPIRHNDFLAKMQGTWAFYDTSACSSQAFNKYGKSEYGLALRMKLIIKDSTYTVYIEEYLPEPNKKLKPIEEEVMKSEGKVKLSQSPMYSDEDLNFALVKLFLYNSINPDFDHYSGRNLSWDNTKQAFMLSYYRGAKCKFNGYFERVQ